MANSKSDAIAKAGNYPTEHNKREAKVIETAESYEPTTAEDWSPVPTTISEALDELAARSLSSTFVPDEETDWVSPPTSIADALDELAQRVTDGPYTPDEATDWNTPPTSIAAALDELAARLKILEGVVAGLE